MPCFYPSNEAKIELLLSFIDSLNDADTVRYKAELDGQAVAVPVEVKDMKIKLVKAIRLMEEKLNLPIDFRGFEWLKNMLEPEMNAKKPIRRSSLGLVVTGRRGSSLLFTAPKFNASIPILIAIKNCYAKDSHTIDPQLEALVIKIFTDRDFVSREFARNTAEISLAQGRLEPVENLQVNARLYRRRNAVAALTPFIFE